MAENFLNLNEESDIQIQEAQRILNKMNPSSTSRHIIIKILKVKHKESILMSRSMKESHI